MKALTASAISVACIAACAAPGAGPAHRYIGTTNPSTPGPLCPASKAEAQIRDGQIILAPDEGTWVLDGLVSSDGTVSADKTIQGTNKQAWITAFQGHWTPTSITGTYTTPRCTFSIFLNAR
jgi:hypothetical protein